MTIQCTECVGWTLRRGPRGLPCKVHEAASAAVDERWYGLVRRIMLAGLALALTMTVASCSGATSATTEDQVPSPTASAEATAEARVLTVENSESLASLLAGPAYGESVEAFAEEFGGGAATIAFDGQITYLLASERVTNSSAYIVAGDYGATPTTGPTFEITPVLLPADSPLQQSNLSEGQNIRLTAQVGYFEHHDASAITDEVNRIHLVPLSIESR